MKTLNKISIIISLFLAGCAEIKTPTGNTNVSSKPYFCRGSWHYPQNYYEYDKVGLASWYGNDFHGKQKASGETFNMMDMTAAHKTLPIPSVVKVTNQNTGKSIVVVVDDRGPFFYKGRIIDLSYAAAKALNLHKKKPSPVRLQVLVSDSLKLSNYIAKHCIKRRDPFGRSWSQLYFQEILGKGLNVYKRQGHKEIRHINRQKPINTKVSSNQKIHKPQYKKQKIQKKRYNSLGRYI